MRRYAVFVAAVLGLLLLGARTRAPVLPPSAQPGFQRVLVAVNQKHALGPDARITDISIQKRRVQLELEIGGRELRLLLVHRGAPRIKMHCRDFGFSYDENEWSGHRAELGKLAKLIDREFSTTPWFTPGGGPASQPLELSQRLWMTLFVSSWLIGLAGVALLLRRRSRR